MSRLVIDLDGTLTLSDTLDYTKVLPNLGVINQLKKYKEQGFLITIFTARNMRTYQGDIAKITQFTLPIILEWLNKHQVPYDEVIVGKPWCHSNGFYIDDRAIRPSEFISMNPDEIQQLLENEKKCF